MVFFKCTFGFFDYIKQKMRLLNVQIKEIEKTKEKIKKNKDKREQIIYAKAKIDILTEQLKKATEIEIQDNSNRLIGEIELLQKKLEKYNLKRLYYEWKEFFIKEMNAFCENLDFEKELAPPQFNFSLNDFLFWHQDKKLGKITLSEFGSGANWLASHLSIFTTFLHFFQKQENATVPSFLIIDQPSQVYFPSEIDRKKDKDIHEVENIYIRLIEKLNQIKEDTGYLPQIIITDHADDLDFGKYNFESYVRRRWKKDKDEGLI